MQTYETVVVIKPQLSDPEVAELVEKTKKVITSEGGEFLAEDKWGRRKLTYPIRQQREGFYVYLKFKAPPTVAPKLEHYFRVQEQFLRRVTVVARERRPLPVKTKVKA